MKLAFCIFNYFPFGGLQRDFLAITKECQKRGHEIHVYTMQWDDKIPLGFEVHLIPKKGFSNHARANYFSTEIQKLKHSNKYQSIIGFNKTAGLDVYFAGDIPLKNKCFLSRLTRRYRIFKKLEKAVFSPQTSTKILVLTPQQQQEYVESYKTDASRFYLLPPGISPHFRNAESFFQKREEWRENLGLTEKDKMVLMVASYFKTKGLDRALAAIAESAPETHLFVIGGDDPTPYLDKIKKYGIAHRVHFMGSQENTMPFYISADLFLHLAYQEAAGKVLIEAIACNLPVLTTENCGYHFYVTQLKAGTVLSLPFNQEECNRALEMMLVENKPHPIHHEDFFSQASSAASIIEGIALGN